jgi:hypothetical protein
MAASGAAARHSYGMNLSRNAVVATISVTGLIGSAVNGFAAPTGPVSIKPATGTPTLVDTGTMETVRQLVQCGSQMYAVGTFTRIAQGSATYTRNGAFSFGATAPYRMSSWDPEVNGTVNSIGFNGTDCSKAYVGGKFTKVGSTAVKNIAEVTTASGAAVSTFKSKAAGEVESIVGWHGHLLTGGKFTSINGSSAAPYFTSLNPTTGADDGYLRLGIAGNYSYTDQAGNPSVTNPTRIYDQQISHSGTKDLVDGDFTTIGGQSRRQVAVIDLGATAASVDGWHATELDQYCASVEPFYAKGAAWSTDDKTIYVATTGFKPASGPGFSTHDHRAGPCDAAIAFPATSSAVTHSWINYTGCDSLYTTTADTTTVYFGGHERWASNPGGCDGAGPGAVKAQGMVGLSTSSGAVTWSPSRARGHGADDMVLTSAGLWIASDNQQNANQCANYPNHAGICFLPY